MRKRVFRAAVGLAIAGTMGFGVVPVSARAAGGGLALVIGEASYTGLPALSGCALSAHAVAGGLRGLGFAVDEQDDAGGAALYAAVGALQRQLAASPQTPAFVYFCGYATGFGDRPFLVPVSARLDRPADVLTQGLLAKSLLEAAVGGKPSTSVLALDTVPVPGGTAPVPLDALLQPAPPSTLGYIAVIESPLGNTPMPLAAALVPLLHASAVQSAALLADAQRQLTGGKTASVAALQLPDAGLFLAGAPAAPAVVAAPAAAPGVTAPAAPLPDEEQMTDAQRHQVQRALAHLGYYDAQPDGVFGPETRAAIRRWQHEQKAPMTGHLTAREASKLAATWD